MIIIIINFLQHTLRVQSREEPFDTVHYGHVEQKGTRSLPHMQDL